MFFINFSTELIICLGMFTSIFFQIFNISKKKILLILVITFFAILSNKSINIRNDFFMFDEFINTRKLLISILSLSFLFTKNKEAFTQSDITKILFFILLIFVGISINNYLLVGIFIIMFGFCISFILPSKHLLFFAIPGSLLSAISLYFFVNYHTSNFYEVIFISLNNDAFKALLLFSYLFVLTVHILYALYIIVCVKLKTEDAMILLMYKIMLFSLFQCIIFDIHDAIGIQTIFINVISILLLISSVFLVKKATTIQIDNFKILTICNVLFLLLTCFIYKKNTFIYALVSNTFFLGAYIIFFKENYDNYNEKSKPIQILAAINKIETENLISNKIQIINQQITNQIANTVANPINNPINNKKTTPIITTTINNKNKKENATDFFSSNEFLNTKYTLGFAFTIIILLLSYLHIPPFLGFLSFYDIILSMLEMKNYFATVCCHVSQLLLVIFLYKILKNNYIIATNNENKRMKMNMILFIFTAIVVLYPLSHYNNLYNVYLFL